jgi:hypothetical protein
MPLIQIGLFRDHAGDPLSFLIRETTRTSYTHACIITNRLTNEISEANMPHVRRRLLVDAELEGIDVFDIIGLTAEQSASIIAECIKRETAMEPYSVDNLFRFDPILRVIFGEAKDDLSDKSPLICSQYALDVVYDGAGITLLNAPSYEVDPGKVAWSVLLKKGDVLNPVGRTAIASAVKQSLASEILSVAGNIVSEVAPG